MRNNVIHFPTPRKASAEVHACPEVEFIAADGHVGIVINGTEWWVPCDVFEERFVRPAFRALGKAWGQR